MPIAVNQGEPAAFSRSSGHFQWPRWPRARHVGVRPQVCVDPVKGLY